MPILRITKNDYITIKTLFHATSDEKSRNALTYVYFDNSLKLFVASDGHIARVEKPETSFVKNHFFARQDFVLTPKDLKPWNEVEADRDPDEKYPDYARCIPMIKGSKGLKPLRSISLDLGVLIAFGKTIVNMKKDRIILTFGFSGEIKPVLVYGKNGTSGTPISKFYGLIMPVKLLVSGSDYGKKCSLNTQDWSLPWLDSVTESAKCEENEAINEIV